MGTVSEVWGCDALSGRSSCATHSSHIPDRPNQRFTLLKYMKKNNSTKYLTESEAWWEIARRIEIRGLSFGLCNEVVDLRQEDRITLHVKKSMDRAIHELRQDAAAPLTSTPYLWPDDEDGPRIIAAVLLAELAEDAAAEWEQPIEWPTERIARAVEKLTSVEYRAGGDSTEGDLYWRKERWAAHHHLRMAIQSWSDDRILETAHATLNIVLDRVGE